MVTLLKGWLKLDSAEGPPLSELLEVFDDSFEKEHMEATWDEDSTGPKEQGAGLLKEVTPLIIPTAVELKVKAPVAETMLVGYIDLVTENGPIIDHKVVNRTPPANKAGEARCSGCLDMLLIMVGVDLLMELALDFICEKSGFTKPGRKNSCPVGAGAMNLLRAILGRVHLRFPRPLESHKEQST